MDYFDTLYDIETPMPGYKKGDPFDQAPSPQLPSQHVDRQAMNNLYEENAGSSFSSPHLHFPNRPSCFAYYCMDLGDDDTLEEAAQCSYEDWLKWAKQAKTKVQILGSKILTLRIPTQTLISLIKLLRDYPLEPIDFIIHDSYGDDERRRSSVEYYQSRLDDTWNPWADDLDAIRHGLSRVIVRNQKSESSVISEDCVDMIDLDRLSLETPTLGRKNLEQALRRITESESKEARVQAQLDARLLLNTLFQADKGAESLVEMMEKADLNS